MELGLSVEMEISGRAFAILYYVELGGFWWTSVLNSALLPQRQRPDSRPEHEDPRQPHGSEEKGERKKERDGEREREKGKRKKERKKKERKLLK